ncbi:MAG: hypothetical protein WC307_03245 [Candidatus Nanoarchaeia archaeon]|jgi:hypothetical protein
MVLLRGVFVISLMIGTVPFFKNPDEWHCIHAAMQSVIKHFSKDFYSQEFINAFLCPERELWVWPMQVVRAFDEVGMFVRLFTAGDLSVFSDYNSFISVFNNSYVDKTHFGALSESFDYVSNKNLIEKKSLSLVDIESFINKGCLPIVILGTKKRFGKYVVLTGCDVNNFYYHETGPEKAQPNKAISKTKFLGYWMQEPSMNAVIIVYGKKYMDTFTQLSI